MHQAPAGIDIDMVQQPPDRALPQPLGHFFDFRRLFRDMNMDWPRVISSGDGLQLFG